MKNFWNKVAIVLLLGLILLGAIACKKEKMPFDYQGYPNALWQLKSMKFVTGYQPPFTITGIYYQSKDRIFYILKDANGKLMSNVEDDNIEPYKGY